VDESIKPPTVKQIGRARRKAAQESGPFVASIMEALKQRDLQKAAGATKEELDRNLEQTLRAAWPKDRVEPWHYICCDCDDTGWVIRTCTPATKCGRPFRLPGAQSDDYTGRGKCSPGHSYALPCQCAKGVQRMAGLMRTFKQRESEDFTAATKGFTRAGRK
jgi:hypothetical protein